MVLMLGSMTSELYGANPQNQFSENTHDFPRAASFDPFTGRISRNRVRMRSGPDLNSPILRELEQGNLVEIVGEQEGFYAIKPPTDLKGYVYRTYILDNVVDGENVNIRLEPTLEAPIIAQLHKGDRVEGKVTPSNTKWLEIALPNSVHFYIAKDFVKKASPQDVAAKTAPPKPSAETPAEIPVERTTNVITPVTPSEDAASDAPEQRMSGWIPQENKLYQEWLVEHPGGSPHDFYTEQRADAVQLRGIIQPYLRPVKNRPGNFLLLNHETHQPIAFLYSTQIDLQPKVDKLVTLVGVPRPNHNFAYPAFFVMTAE